jgi:hypothetical protein
VLRLPFPVKQKDHNPTKKCVVTEKVQKVKEVKEVIMKVSWRATLVFSTTKWEAYSIAEAAVPMT